MLQVNSKKYGVDLIRFTHAQNTAVHCSTKIDGTFHILLLLLHLYSTRNIIGPIVLFLLDTIRYLSLHDNKYIRYFPGHTKKYVALLLRLDAKFLWHFVCCGCGVRCT